MLSPLVSDLIWCWQLRRGRIEFFVRPVPCPDRSYWRARRRARPCRLRTQSRPRPAARSDGRRDQSLATGPRPGDRARRQSHRGTARTQTQHIHRLAAQLSQRYAPFRRSQRRPSREAVNLVDLAQAVATPFYCYSTATLRRHYDVFADAFADVKALICYAMKANSNQAVIKTLAGFGAGADVVSEG